MISELDPKGLPALTFHKLEAVRPGLSDLILTDYYATQIQNRSQQLPTFEAGVTSLMRNYSDTTRRYIGYFARGEYAAFCVFDRDTLPTQVAVVDSHPYDLERCKPVNEEDLKLIAAFIVHTAEILEKEGMSELTDNMIVRFSNIKLDE
jgi:hypothetical protein